MRMRVDAQDETVPEASWAWPCCWLQHGTTVRGCAWLDGCLGAVTQGTDSLECFPQVCFLCSVAWLGMDKLGDFPVCLRSRGDRRATSEDGCCSLAAAMARLLRCCLQGVCIQEICCRALRPSCRFNSEALQLFAGFLHKLQPVACCSVAKALADGCCCGPLLSLCSLWRLILWSGKQASSVPQQELCCFGIWATCRGFQHGCILLEKLEQHIGSLLVCSARNPKYWLEWPGLR